MPRRLLRSALAALGAMAMVSCGCDEPPETGGFSQRTEKPANTALATAFDATASELQKVGHHSPVDQLKTAKDRAAELDAQLSALSEPRELDKARLEAVRHELARIDAASAFARSSEEWNRLFKEAKLTRA